MGKHSAVVLTSNQNTEENKEAECLLNACDMTEVSNKLLDKDSVFVGDVFNEAEIYFTPDHKIETSTITLHSDNRSININLNANNKDVELLNAFDLEVSYINIRYAMNWLNITVLNHFYKQLKKIQINLHYLYVF